LNDAIGDVEAEWVQVSVFESVVPALNEAMPLACRLSLLRLLIPASP
jgi:hypothetical protein